MTHSGNMRDQPKDLCKRANAPPRAAQFATDPVLINYWNYLEPPPL